MPLPRPRAANVATSPPAMPWNDEIAHWLLTMLRITGARYTAAKVSALWKSGSAVEPSPIQSETMRVSPLIAEAIAQPTAWMYCSAEIARDREEAVPPRRVHHRHLPPEDRIAVVGEELAHHVDERIAARDQDSLLAVGGEAHVVRRERHCLPDADRLLAQALHVERDLLLPLRGEHPRVEHASLEHRAQPGAQQLGVRVRIPRADRAPVVVQHPDQRVRDVAGLRWPRIDRRLAHGTGGRDRRYEKSVSCPGRAGGSGTCS